MSYSRGCKFAHSLEDKDDDEIMNQTLDEAIFLRDVEDYAFKLICKYKKRAEFLDLVTQDHLTGSFSADSLINDLSDLEQSNFENEVLPIMNNNSDSLARSSLPQKSTPWLSSKEFLWLEQVKKENVTKIDIDESLLPLIAEHLAWLESERLSI